jgi:hypothetical protein
LEYLSAIFEKAERKTRARTDGKTFILKTG